MTIRNFWRLFLKALGIWIITSSVVVALNYLSAVIPFYNEWSGYALLAILFLAIFSVGIFYLIIRYFLFKTEWLIDRFKLDQGFDSEKIDIAVSSQTFIAIVIAILGGINFIDAVPGLCRSLYAFYQQDFIFRQSPKSGTIIFYFVQTVIGFILLTNGAWLSKLLIKKSEDNFDLPSD